MLAGVLLCAASAGAWENRVTHEALTRSALESRSATIATFLRMTYGLEEGLDSGLRIAPGIEPAFADILDGQQEAFETMEIPLQFARSPVGTPLFTPPEPGAEPREFSVREILDAGAFAEGAPLLREYNHFYDPVFERDGRRSLKDPLGPIFAFPQLFPVASDFSSLDRAFDRAPVPGTLPSSEGRTRQNVFALDDAERYLYRAFVGANEAERETALALHFAAIGHVLHLLQDAGEPGHVRNDFVAADNYLYLLGGSFVGEVAEKLGLGVFVERPGERLVARYWRLGGAFLKRALAILHVVHAGEIAVDALEIAHFPKSLESTGSSNRALALAPRFSNLNTQLANLPVQELAALGAPNVDLSQFRTQLRAYREDLIDPNVLALQGSDRLWDQSDPAQEMQTDTTTTRGLARRVNAEFLSPGSIRFGAPGPDFNAYPEPAVPEPTAEGCGSNFLPWRNEDGSFAGFSVTHEDGTVDKIYFATDYLSTPTVPHLAICRKTAEELRNALEELGGTIPPDKAVEFYSLRDWSVQWDYVELLFPLIVDYSARFLVDYMAPRIDVVPEGSDRFRLVNLTPYRFVIASNGVEIAFDQKDGTRLRVPIQCTGELVLEPSASGNLGAAGEPSSEICDLPATLPSGANPVNRADFYVVARGVLGNRGGLVSAPPAGDETSWMGQRFAVGVRHIPGNQLLYGGRVVTPEYFTATTPEEIDREEQFEIFSVDVDPLADLDADPDAKPAEPVNLTDPIRFSRGTSSTDFAFPAADPKSRRVAIRSDLGVPQELSGVFPNGRFLDVMFLDPEVDPQLSAALVPLPLCILASDGTTGCFPHRHEFEFGGTPMTVTWASDGQALAAFAGSRSYLTEALDDAQPPSRELLRLGEQQQPFEFVEGAILDRCNRDASGGYALKSPTEIAWSANCTRSNVVADSQGNLGLEDLVEGFDVLTASLVPDPDIPLFAVTPSAMARIRLPGGPEDCSLEADGFDCGETTENLEEILPAYSPDGARLAFIGGNPRDPNILVNPTLNAGPELWVLDAGGTLTRLVNLAGSHRVMRSPAWSPGGEWIAVVVDDVTLDDANQIYVVDANGGPDQTPRRIADVDVFNLITWRSPTPFLLPGAAP